MTELHIGLIGLGVIAVFGVVVYNTWLEYRHRKLAQQLLQPLQDDVLLGRGEVGARELPEPEFSEIADAGAVAVPAYAEVSRPERTAPDAVEPRLIEPKFGDVPLSGERIEPVLRAADDDSESDSFPPAPALSGPETPLEMPVNPAPSSAPVSATPEILPVTSGALADASREMAEPLHLLSPAVDYIAAFEAVEPASATQILESQRAALSHVRKPVHWFGYDELAHEWEEIRVADGKEYRSIRVGLQLVDRRGPAAESDLTAFHVAMHDLAHELMAIVDMPQRQTALDAAKTLDEFCASVDIQIGINVVATGSLFPGTKIRALAEAAGMLIDDSGRFVRADDDGNILYVLVNQEAAGFSPDAMKSMTTHGLTFLLDVPTVSHGDRVFNQIVDLAKRFADVLKGVLVDDNRRPLPDGALEPIRRQISQYQSSMAGQKLPAGSRLTKRLFS